MKTHAKLLPELEAGDFRGSWRDSVSHFDNAITHPWYKLIFSVTSEIVFATYEYFREKKFAPALAPVTALSITSPMGLGSDSQPVSVNLFGQDIYLVDSMQFHLEYLLRQNGRGVFYIMPTFRNEDADSRHLNEFFHIEAEFIGNFEDNLVLIEGLLFAYVDRLLETCADEIESFTGEVSHLLRFQALRKAGLPRISFKEASLILGDNREFYSWHDDRKVGVSCKGEAFLMSERGSPLWLTHLPKIGVPFYQADADDGESSLCADLLMGIGEVVGSGQRHLTCADTLRAIAEREVNPECYDWYLRMKKSHPMQTSGFGIGLERFLLWVLRHDDIRDTQLFIRQKGLRASP